MAKKTFAQARAERNPELAKDRNRLRAWAIGAAPGNFSSAIATSKKKVAADKCPKCGGAGTVDRGARTCGQCDGTGKREE